MSIALVCEAIWFTTCVSLSGQHTNKTSCIHGAFDYSRGQFRVSAYILIEKTVDLIYPK